MKKPVTIVVTQLEYEKGKVVFVSAEKEGLVCIPVPKDEIRIAESVRKYNARHAILGDEMYTNELYHSLSRGGVLARFGVGYDGIDLSLASSRMLFCTNTPGVLEESVAELTIALIVSGARHISELSDNMRKGVFSPILGIELRGKKLAVIGCGAIGCKVASIASAGFGMIVTGCEVRDMDVNAMKRDCGFTSITRDFTKAVSNADFVTLHIPSTPETFHFINSDRLSMLPDKAWLINTARGAVVDENALYDALETGIIRGAALDVFEKEPYIPMNPAKDLRTLPRVILTPHAGSSTVEACHRVAERVLLNITHAERKEYQKMNLLNPAVLENLK